MTNPEAAGVPAAVTYREISELLRTFAASGWTGMTLRVNGMTITAGRHGPPASAIPTATAAPAAAAAPAPAAAAAASSAALPAAAPSPAATVIPSVSSAPSTSEPSPDVTDCVPVRSPAVGSFWTAPSPGAAPFTEAGQTVAEGDQLAIVEVMKLMNPVLATQAGQVVQVCAGNAELVEYDQVLFWIRPAEPAGG